MADPRPTVARLRALVDRARPPCVTLLVPIDPRQESVSGAGALRVRRAREALAARLEELAIPEGRRKRLLDTVEAHLDASPPPHDVRVRALLAWEEGALRFGIDVVGDLREDAPRVAVGSSFLLRPLLRAARLSRAFLVLSVSVNHVALYASEDDGRRLRALPREGLPESLEDALGHDLGQRGEQLQFHSEQGAGRSPIFHGQHGSDQDMAVDLMRYHRTLGSALRERLRDEERPIVLAADQRHQAALREEAGSLPILEDGIIGSPDHRPGHELAAEARGRVEAWLARRDAAGPGALERARTRGKAAVGLDETLRAVAMGRAGRVFVPALGAHPGRIDASALRATAPWGDEDLADELAALALRQGGEVIPWEPGHPPADGVEFAAVLR